MILFALLLPLITAVAGNADDLKQRTVLLHTTSMDTRSAPEFDSNVAWQNYLTQFSDSTKHQYIVHVKSPAGTSKMNIGTCVVDVFSRVSKNSLRNASVESNLNVKLHLYLPHNSYFVVETANNIKRLREHRDVLWIGGFEPEHRVVSELRPDSSVATGAAPGSLLVMLAPSTTSAEWLALSRTNDAAIAAIEAVAADRIRIDLQPDTQWDGAARVAAWAALHPLTHWVESLRKLVFNNM
jgi:hypothetical protein